MIENLVLQKYIEPCFRSQTRPGGPNRGEAKSAIAAGSVCTTWDQDGTLVLNGVGRMFLPLRDQPGNPGTT